MTPIKPFDTYKWRWLSVAPTESLLDPPVFLGVLRALARHEGEAPSVPAVAEDLRTVQIQTRTPVDLVRTPERNLIRNSGQYWKGTGLLEPEPGLIRLTPLGRMIANRLVTQAEFAAIMVQQTVLPNPWTYNADEIAKWRAAGLEIRPLALILTVMELIGLAESKADAYLTPGELIGVTIPLAGAKVTPPEISRAVLDFRRGRLNVASWPDCAPAANDHRLAREFLLFLGRFGLCRMVPDQTNAVLDEKYYLDELPDTAQLEPPRGVSMFAPGPDPAAIVDAVRHSDLPSLIERQRTLVSVLKRPGQSQFRDNVLRASGTRCLLSGEQIREVLEAAHIVPVEYGGDDVRENGLCLRVDLHRLFDSGNIRLRPSGDLVLSGVVRSSQNYAFLPTRATVPNFVNPANVAWRDSYT